VADERGLGIDRCHKKRSISQKILRKFEHLRAFVYKELARRIVGRQVAVAG
jgi:hypothetical protein